MRRPLLLALVYWACLLPLGRPPVAQTASWVSVRELKGADTVCLDVTGNRVDYSVLGPQDRVQTTLQGPRRLKLIGRYLFAPEDPERVRYTLIVDIGGEEVLRKRFTGLPHESVILCRGQQRVGSLRRAFVDLPSGRHVVSIRAENEGQGQVGVRLFRQLRRRRESWVTFAPDESAEVRHLQFDSGNQSTYYQFTADKPLRLSVTGPTTLRLSTRLDFDHTMNGVQQYSLQTLLNGEPSRAFHFDCTALTSAAYVERPDILPGVRKNLRIPIPRGAHTVEVRCLRPDNCSVATMIHIPMRDVQR